MHGRKLNGRLDSEGQHGRHLAFILLSSILPRETETRFSASGLPTCSTYWWLNFEILFYFKKLMFCCFIFEKKLNSEKVLFSSLLNHQDSLSPHTHCSKGLLLQQRSAWSVSLFRYQCKRERWCSSGNRCSPLWLVGLRIFSLSMHSQTNFNKLVFNYTCFF